MNFILLVAIAGLVACTYAAPSDGAKKHHMGMHMCLGKNLTFTDAMKTSMKSCWGKKADNKTKRAADEVKKDFKHGNMNMTCKAVCEYKGYGLISTDGKVVKDTIGAFIKQVYPESVTDALTKSITSCVDQHGASVEIKDGKCDSYEPMFTCIFKAKREACKESS